MSEIQETIVKAASYFYHRTKRTLSGLRAEKWDIEFQHLIDAGLMEDRDGTLRLTELGEARKRELLGRSTGTGGI